MDKQEGEERVDYLLCLIALSALLNEFDRAEGRSMENGEGLSVNHARIVNARNFVENAMKKEPMFQKGMKIERY